MCFALGMMALPCSVIVTTCIKSLYVYFNRRVRRARECCSLQLRQAWCKYVHSAGAVLQCLGKHRENLSPECRKEELKLNILQSQDVRLQPTLHKQCSEEIAVFCPEVNPG